MEDLCIKFVDCTARVQHSNAGFEFLPEREKDLIFPSLDIRNSAVAELSQWPGHPQALQGQSAVLTFVGKRGFLICWLNSLQNGPGDAELRHASKVSCSASFEGNFAEKTGCRSAGALLFSGQCGVELRFAE